QVDVDFPDARVGQVADGDLVDAAQGSKVHPLDLVGVHRDVGDVAGEPQPRAVGGDVDLLSDVGAVELHRVGAGLALDDVVAVAGVQIGGRAPAAPRSLVFPAAPDDQLVAAPAKKEVVPAPAGDGVVARAAVHCERDQGGQSVAAGERVVAAVH